MNARIFHPKLGTFAGVFTPSILTILGLILFLRIGFVVGNAGLIETLGIIAVAHIISILTSFSLAGIATHLNLKAGGDYYVISRTLGLGFGGSIGIVLFAAQSISVGFYCLGFAEAVAALVGIGHFVVQPIAAVVVMGVMILAWLGTDWATRFQYVVMGLIVFALGAFIIGGWRHWDTTQLSANLYSPEDGLPFWVLFAVFFPAVTGFTQGVSMSGDLRNPGSSIPTGTFAAVGLSLVVYVGVAILFAAAQPLTALAADYGAMKRISLWSPLIDAGVFAATLSSALASFLGAPRILQSLAKDRIFPILSSFAQGTGPSANPRRAVVMTGVVALSVVALGDLNAVASIVTMFFLVSYGLLNYATYYEARARSPSFRPRFRLYDERVSLCGALVCLSVMIAIDLRSGTIATLIIAAIYYYLYARGVPARWADSRRSYYLQRARESLLAAAREPLHPRDWRPQLLVFSDDAARRPRLLQLAEWVEAGSGLTTIVRVIESDSADVVAERGKALSALDAEIKEHNSTAFPLVVAATTLEEGIAVAIQAAGIGPLGINTVIANMSLAQADYFGDWGGTRYGRNLRAAFRLGCNLLILDATAEEWAHLDSLEPQRRRIDVWWTEGETTALILLLAHLITRADDWHDAEIRVLVAGTKGGGRHKKAEETLNNSHIDGELIAVGQFTPEVVIAASKDAALVFLPMSMDVGESFRVFGLSADEFLSALPVVVLAVAAEDIELTSDPDTGVATAMTLAADHFSDAARALRDVQAQERKAAKRLTSIETQISETRENQTERRNALDDEKRMLCEKIATLKRRRLAAEQKMNEAQKHLRLLNQPPERNDADSN